MSCPLSLLQTGKIGNFTNNELWNKELWSLVRGTITFQLGQIDSTKVYDTLKSIAIPWFVLVLRQSLFVAILEFVILLPWSLTYLHYRWALYWQFIFLSCYTTCSSRTSICKGNNSLK